MTYEEFKDRWTAGSRQLCNGLFRRDLDNMMKQHAIEFAMWRDDIHPDGLEAYEPYNELYDQFERKRSK
jgi:Holliday junction resolvase RusA-like endonuclease